jgi:asparagine synthase (glutamine-hydrolysing)
MCGIAGIKFLDQKVDVDIDDVLKSMSHRGPDAQQHKLINNAHLFHSRLSIIDLDTRSNQPFTDPTGRYSVVFNGEIYNFRELRKTLDYAFRTESDTEVLLALLIIRGKDAIRELDGMFAFAFFDSFKGNAILARDIFGEKPLYYSVLNGNIYFASEIRTLLKLTQRKGLISKNQLSNWLHWQTIPGDSTLLDDIFQVKPGSFIEFDCQNKKTKSLFWEIQKFRTQQYTNQEEILRNLDILIHNAVSKRLVSDVPFASFLSGGIDSSIISMLASKELSSRLNTFTIGFAEDKFSEHIEARALAKQFGTNHHEFILHPDYLFQNLECFFNSMDFPTADGMNSYIISSVTRKQGFKMALSGLGGDEWFMGYSKMSSFPYLNSIRYLGAFDSLDQYLPSKYKKLLNVLNGIKLLGGGAYPLNRVFFDSSSIVKNLNLPKPNLIPSGSKEAISHSIISILEMEYYTTPVLLKDSDQYSMANGLELRCPFMDKSLVEFVLGISDNNFSISRPKELLRLMYKDQLPDFVFNNKKKGFTFPWEIWLRNELSGFCETNLNSFSQRINDDGRLLKHWKIYKAGSSNEVWSKFWGLISIEQWMLRNDINIY